MTSGPFACLFAPAPIRQCGSVAPFEPVLASSWPLAVMMLVILLMAGWAFLRSIYPRRIDWSRDRPIDWDVGADDRPTIEIRVRRAGE